MTYAKFLITLIIVSLSAVSAPALAHGSHYRGGWGHHHRSSVHLGFVFGPGFYYPPAYYYPPAVVVRPAPVYYIEQSQPAPEQGYWYYCSDSKAYYPYVQQCASPWARVSPQPPSQ